MNSETKNKPKILFQRNFPFEYLEKYADDYELTLPTEENGRFTYEEIIEMIPEYDAYLNIIVPVDKNMIDIAKNLKVIGCYGVGYDAVDWKYATEVGIPIIHTPQAVMDPTAEMAIALMMDVMRGVSRYDREIRSGSWNAPLFPKVNKGLNGSTLGIVGFGRIGKAVSVKARGLGMNVVYFNRHRASEEVEKEYGVTYMPFEELIATCDCVSLNAPYFQENHHLFNAETFAKMKPSAYFVNTSRGKLVDEEAMCQALKDGVIAGAGLDVFESEPHPFPGLLDLENVVLTPHAGTLTRQGRINTLHEAMDGLIGVINGERPVNTVNPSVYDK